MGPEPESLFRSPTEAVPLALYVGAQHILTSANQVWRDLYVGITPIGCPAREIFRGHMGRRFVEALDRARSTGEVQMHPCHEHESTVVITPLIERGRVVGLVSGCGLERLAPMTASPLGPLDLPALARSA